MRRRPSTQADIAGLGTIVLASALALDAAVGANSTPYAIQVGRRSQRVELPRRHVHLALASLNVLALVQPWTSLSAAVPAGEYSRGFKKPSEGQPLAASRTLMSATTDAKQATTRTCR